MSDLVWYNSIKLDWSIYYHFHVSLKLIYLSSNTINVVLAPVLNNTFVLKRDDNLAVNYKLSMKYSQKVQLLNTTSNSYDNLCNAIVESAHNVGMTKEYFGNTSISLFSLNKPWFNDECKTM